MVAVMTIPAKSKAARITKYDLGFMVASPFSIFLRMTSFIDFRASSLVMIFIERVVYAF